MAQSQRVTIASAIGTMLYAISTATASGTSPVFNIVKTVNNVDNKYPYDLDYQELPAIKIYFFDESVQYSPNLRAMNKLGADLYIYCVEWDKETITAEEDLLKVVRNALGSDIRILGSCVNHDIKTIVKMEMQYPLVMYKMNINFFYEGSISNL